MLVKYYGLIFNKEKDHWSPRTDFISNGLFRITQPIFLNDKGSELKLFPYFNEFSPVDLKWAFKQFQKQSIDSYIPPDEFLIKLFLMPGGLRYGEAMPHLLLQETGYENINDYDKNKFEITVKAINDFLLQALSCRLGIFSLSKTDVNEHMWTHYGGEGKGIAVTFNKEHEFFKRNLHMDVSYKPEDRATITYYKGSVRINGELARNFKFEENESSILSMLKSGIDISDLSNRLLFSKAEHWQLEDESRIVFNLSQRDHGVGHEFIPSIDEIVKEMFPSIFPEAPEFCLKKIPFDAFESLVFGFSIDPKIEKLIIAEIKSNNELAHLKLKRVKHNIFGKLETENVV